MTATSKKLPKSTAPILRLNALCPYFTMFPLQFPFDRLRGATMGDWVLDPFCGRGTTNFAARLRGLPSVGIDSNPVAAAIASAKFAKTSPNDVMELCASILQATRFPRHIPVGEFWSRCYHSETLVEICKIREYFLRRCATDSEIVLRALMLGILHGPRHKGPPSYLSNQMPRTYSTKAASAICYWRSTRSRPLRISTRQVVERRAQFSLSALPPKTSGRVIFGDSQECRICIGPRKFRWVVTSPPYFGMRTYLPDQWLRNWFLGGDEQVDYSETGQLPHQGTDQFVRALSRVWANIARACENGANLIVRFGCLPSLPQDPASLFKLSLRLANCGWRLMTTREAGSALEGKRQACQFKRSKSDPYSELDLYAILEV
jgi:hypothetical protein